MCTHIPAELLGCCHLPCLESVEPCPPHCFRVCVCSCVYLLVIKPTSYSKDLKLNPDKTLSAVIKMRRSPDAKHLYSLNVQPWQRKKWKRLTELLKLGMCLLRPWEFGSLTWAFAPNCLVFGGRTESTFFPVSGLSGCWTPRLYLWFPWTQSDTAKECPVWQPHWLWIVAGSPEHTEVVCCPGWTS